MSFALLPPGLTLCQLGDDRALGEDCRRFCLRTIKSTYGYDYRPDWHSDLDSLCEGSACHYAARNRGAFFVLRDTDGRVIGTAGMRGLCHKPDIAAMLSDRYPEIDRVAFNGRLYVDPVWRRHGLGQILMLLREEAARRMGYATVYIHCDAKAERLRQYWLRHGFRLITADDSVAHYDKPL